MSESTMTPRQLMERAVTLADARKASDIIVMEVTEKTTLADYFVIMTGTSAPHIKALSEEIEFKLKNENGIYPHHIEGVTSNWILLDYGTVVINIFLSEARELYALERLWGDALKVDIEKLLIKGE